MAAEDAAPNGLRATGRHAKPIGDVPEDLKRRYFLDSRGGLGLGFYPDATSAKPSFRDRGDRLVTTRTDPHVIRHLTAIARHRGWAQITLTGEPAFRREAWLVARAEGLEVRGYKPTVRDEQALEKRLEQERRREAWATLGRDLAQTTAHPNPVRDLAAAAPQLKVAESVIRSRIADPAAQGRLLEAARERIAGWLERGGRFDVPQRDRQPDLGRDRARQR